MSLYGGSFAPQQHPPHSPPGDIKHSATCPPPLPTLRRLPNCPVRGQAELTKWDLTGVSLLGTGWSGDANSAPTPPGSCCHSVAEANGQGHGGLGSA